MVAAKALFQLVIYGLVIAIALSLLSQMLYGGEPVCGMASEARESAGKIVTSGDPQQLWLQSEGEVTTVFRPVHPAQMPRIVPPPRKKPPSLTVEEILRHYQVKTVGELVRKTLLGELKPPDLGT